jgi:hypothetical protein
MHPTQEIGRRFRSKWRVVAWAWTDENGAFSAELHRPGMRADGRAQADFHVMRGSQGSMANTSSRRVHGRYHVDTAILRNFARSCSVDADADLLKMLDIPACDACLSGKTGRFGSDQHVHEYTAPGEVVCCDLWSTRTGCVYNAARRLCLAG